MKGFALSLAVLTKSFRVRVRDIFNCLAYYGFYIELFWTYLVYCRVDRARWVEICPDTKYSL